MKPRSTSRLAFPLATAIAALLAVPSASATDLYWDIDGATAGAGGAAPVGTWNTTNAVWSTSPNGTLATSAVTTSLLDDLFFSAGVNATGAYAITLNDTQAAKSLTFRSGTATISGAGGVITLGGTGIINVTNSLLAAPNNAIIGANTNTIIGGSAGLTKTGVGTLTLNGTDANTFTGGLNVNGGILVLDFANRGANANLLDTGNALGLGGGTLSVIGNSANDSAQTFDNVTVNSGGGNILVNPNGAGRAATLTLGSLTSTASGGSLLIGKTPGAAGTATITTTSSVDATGIYGGRVVFSDGVANTGFNWATNTGGAGPTYTLSAYAGYAALDLTAGSDSANSRISANQTMAGSRTTNSLKFENPATAQTLTIGSGNTLTLSNGGLLFTGASVTQGPRIGTIVSSASVGSITAGNGSGSYDLVVHQYNVSSTIAIGSTGTTINNNTSINANIVNNGANAVTLVKNGPGGLVVGGTSNTFTGGIIVNEGNLAFNSATAINNNAITFNANSIVHTFGGSSTSGNITLNNNSQVTFLNNNSSFTVTGNVTGSGGISAANGGQGAITLNLNGTGNNFAGPIRFTANNATQPATINMASLADTDTLRSGNITFGAGSAIPTANTFGLSSNAVAVTLTNRHFEMAGDLVLHQINNAGTNAFTINSDLIVTGTRAKHLGLGGAGAGISTFAGVIANHATPTAAGTVPIAMRTTGVVPAGTAITLGSVEGIVAGATISGTGIAAGTTIASVNYANRVVTLSAATTSAIPITTVFTIPGAVNSVSVTKTDAGTWVLSGTNNSYTGSTFVAAGTLEVTKLADAGLDSSIGKGGAGTSSVFLGSGTTLRYSGGTASTTNRGLTYFANAASTGFVLDASGTGTGTVEFSSTAAIANTTINQERFFTLTGNNTGNNTQAAQINNNGTGATNITKNGTGKWVLTNANSSYTGGTFINNGMLSINSIKDGGVASAIGAGTRFTLGSSNDSGTLEYTGNGDSSNRDTRIGTPSTLPGTGGGSILNNGNGALTFTSTTFNISQTGIVNTRTLTLGGSYTGGANEIQGIIQDNTASTGLVNLEKTGAGTWKLSGNNSYTGTTTVSGGTLLINGNSSTATGNVNVNAGTLGGTGTLGGAVSVAGGATLAPGASIESLAAPSLGMVATSIFAYEVANNTSNGADLLAVGGTVSLTGVTLSLDAASLAALAGGGWNIGDKLTLISYLDAGSGISSGFTGYVDDISYFFGANEWLFNYNDTLKGGNYSADADANGQNRFVTMTLVPEPGTALLGSLGLLALLRRRR